MSYWDPDKDENEAVTFVGVAGLISWFVGGWQGVISCWVTILAIIGIDRLIDDWTRWKEIAPEDLKYGDPKEPRALKSSAYVIVILAATAKHWVPLVQQWWRR